MTQMYAHFFVFSVVMLIALILLFRARVSVFYILLFFGTAISNLGYMQIAAATSLESAIFANQVVYVGTGFIPFYLIECFSDLCRIRLKKWVEFLLFSYSVILLFLVFTIGRYDVYYRDVQLLKEFGITFIAKEYGSLHILYPAYLIITLVMAVGLILQAFAGKKEVSRVTSICLLGSCMIAVAIYITEKQAGLKVELMPFAYAVLQLVILVLLKRISLYNVEAITTDSMMESMSHGFVLYDSNGKYLGSDQAAKMWFPELEEIRVDTYIKDESSPLLGQIGRWNRGEDTANMVLIERDDMIVEAQHTVIVEKSKKTVHCVYLRDDTKQQLYTKLVEKYNTDLETDVRKKTKKISEIQNDIIVGMASIVENRDNNTGGHIKRSSDVVRIFVKFLRKNKQFPELTEEVADCIIKAAPLHDFGKIAIPDVILNKPGKFTPEEYEKMKEHSAKGALIVEQILQNSEDEQFKQIAVNIAHFHHERWDGSGYPTKIAGEEIPFEARVMALADVFDALVSKRVYKESFSYDQAFRIIEESGGNHFEPELCKLFLECRPKLEALYNSYED